MQQRIEELIQHVALTTVQVDLAVDRFENVDDLLLLFDVAAGIMTSACRKLRSEQACAAPEVASRFMSTN